MGLFRRHEDAPVEEPEGDVIDLTDDAERAEPSPGVPGRCPECGGFGYIDNIDMVHRYQTQHCRDCGHIWEFSFDEEEPAFEPLDLGDPWTQTSGA